MEGVQEPLRGRFAPWHLIPVATPSLALDRRSYAQAIIDPHSTALARLLLQAQLGVFFVRSKAVKVFIGSGSVTITVFISKHHTQALIDPW